MEVIHIIHDMNVNKSTGIDDISAKSIKMLSDLIAPSIADICNLSICNGVSTPYLKKLYFLV